jgi:hypothetical protein
MDQLVWCQVVVTIHDGNVGPDLGDRFGDGRETGAALPGTRAAPFLHRSRFRRKKRTNQRNIGWGHRISLTIGFKWRPGGPPKSLRAAALIWHHSFKATKRNFLALGGLRGCCRLSHLPHELAKILVTGVANAYIGSPSFLSLYLVHGIA